MATHLFLASTPFNMLCSAMVAFELPAEDNAILGLIDQPQQQRPFVDALLQWTESPFDEIRLLSHQAKGKQKRDIRRQAFRNIDQLLSEITPDQIYTGNDRRVEFQYAMHKSGCDCGVYLDDGTYSYLGGKDNWLKDRLLDGLVKKLGYGLWWKQPPTIGGSDWIQQAVLAFPDAAVKALKDKELTALPQNLNRQEFTSLAKLSIGTTAINEEALFQLDALLLLPHESVTDPDIRQRLTYWLSGQSGRIAFKHHPRTQLKSEDGDKQTWGLAETATQVPAGIPIEVLLPLIKKDCQLAGDVSTALLTAKWLRPELDVTAFCTESTKPDWINLLHRLGIQTVGKSG